MLELDNNFHKFQYNFELYDFQTYLNAILFPACMELGSLDYFIICTYVQINHHMHAKQKSIAI